MIYSEQGERTQIIAMLFGAYEKAGDSKRQAIYVKMLEDIPNELLKKAVKRIILNNKFLPSVSEIVEAAKSLVGSIDEKVRTKSWDEAYGEIERKMQSTPWGVTPEWSTPEIATAVNAFGWHDLQTCMQADMPIVRAQLRRFYEDACSRRQEQQINAYVLGKEVSVLPVFRVIELPKGKTPNNITLSVGTICEVRND